MEVRFSSVEWAAPTRDSLGDPRYSFIKGILPMLKHLRRLSIHFPPTLEVYPWNEYSDLHGILSVLEAPPPELRELELWDPYAEHLQDTQIRDFSSRDLSVTFPHTKWKSTLAKLGAQLEVLSILDLSAEIFLSEFACPCFQRLHTLHLHLPGVPQDAHTTTTFPPSLTSLTLDLHFSILAQPHDTPMSFDTLFVSWMSWLTTRCTFPSALQHLGLHQRFPVHPTAPPLLRLAEIWDPFWRHLGATGPGRVSFWDSRGFTYLPGWVLEPRLFSHGSPGWSLKIPASFWAPNYPPGVSPWSSTRCPGCPSWIARNISRPSGSLFCPAFTPWACGVGRFVISRSIGKGVESFRVEELTLWIPRDDEDVHNGTFDYLLNQPYFLQPLLGKFFSRLTYLHLVAQVDHLDRSLELSRDAVFGKLRLRGSFLPRYFRSSRGSWSSPRSCGGEHNGGGGDLDPCVLPLALIKPPPCKQTT